MMTSDLSVCEQIDITAFLPKNIVCIECKRNFVFSEGKQGFFRSRGLSNEPRRCPHCRVLMRMRREGKPTDTVTETTALSAEKKQQYPFSHVTKKRFCAQPVIKQKVFKEEQEHRVPTGLNQNYINNVNR